MKERQFLFCRISTGFPVIDFKTLSLLSPQSHFKGIALNNRNNQIFILCKSRPPRKSCLFSHKTGPKLKEEGQSWFCCHTISQYGIKEKKTMYSLLFFFLTNTTMFCDTAHFLYLMPQSAAFVFVASWETSFLSTLEVVLKCRSKVEQKRNWIANSFSPFFLSSSRAQFPHFVRWQRAFQIGLGCINNKRSNSFFFSESNCEIPSPKQRPYSCKEATDLILNRGCRSYENKHLKHLKHLNAAYWQ